MVPFLRTGSGVVTMQGTFRRLSADLDAIKLRLVREAVQDNIVGPPAFVRRTAASPRFALPALVATSFLIACLIYLSMPGAVLSRVGVASASPTGMTAVEPSVPGPG